MVSCDSKQSKAMAKLGDLVVRVGADTVPLNTALGNVKKTLRNENWRFGCWEYGRELERECVCV